MIPNTYLKQSVVFSALLLLPFIWSANVTAEKGGKVSSYAISMNGGDISRFRQRLQLDNLSFSQLDQQSTVIVSGLTKDKVKNLVASIGGGASFEVIHGGSEELDYAEVSLLLRGSINLTHPKPVQSSYSKGIHSFYDEGITGQNITIGLLDSGIKTTHGELGGVEIEINTNSQEYNNEQYDTVPGLRSSHGTATVCDMVARDNSTGSPDLYPAAYLRGTSYGVQKVVFDYAGDKDLQKDPISGELVSEDVAIDTTLNSLHWITHVQKAPIDLLNYSFGHGQVREEEGDYSFIAQAFDSSAYINRYLPFKSVGNRKKMIPLWGH